MAGSLGTLWARYKTLFIFWGITLVLIGAALVIQWWEADLSNRFVVTQQTTVNGIQVAVTYPSQVLLPSTNAPVQEMIFRVTAPEATKYVLWLEGSQGLIFYDNGGEVVSPRWKGQGNAVFRSRVQALPGTGEERIFLQAKLSVDSLQYPISPGWVVIESPAQSRWRIFGDIFARNIALPLGLLSAVAGWAVSYLAKETDKLEIAFREKMGKLASEFHTDPLYVVQQCLELKRLVSKKSLGRDAEQELNDVVRNLFNQNGVGKLLKQIGQRANRQDNVAFMAVLFSVASFYKKFASVFKKEAGVDAVFRALRYLYYYFSEQKNFVLLYDLERPLKMSTGKMEFLSWALIAAERAVKWQTERYIKKAKNAVEQLLRIWDEQDVCSADFVLYGLNRFQGVQSLQTWISADQIRSAHRYRLKRYKQLGWLHDPLASPYQWPALQVQDEPYRYPKLHTWFNSCGVLISNPFDKSYILQLKIWPEKWEHFISDEPIIFTSRSMLDLVDAALLAQKGFQDSMWYGQRDANLFFPIFFDLPVTLEDDDWLSVLAHRAAEVWLEFLAYSPDAYLDMYPEERNALSSWLGWHCGSTEIVTERLRQQLFRVLVDTRDKENNEKKAQEKERAGQLLLDFLAGGKCTYAKENRPSWEQMLYWLSIHPFGIDRTVVILVAKSILPSPLSQALAEESAVLLAHGIVLKQFRLEGDTLPECSLAITWSKDALKGILANCINRTSGGRTAFSALFETPPMLPDFVVPDYDDQLAEKAAGSLNRLLDLGMKILLHHAEHHVDKPYLLPDDFSVIESS